MIFVIGGYASGKRAFVASHWGYPPTAFLQSEDSPILYGIESMDSSSLCLDSLLEKEVVIAQEIGCGLVPLTPEERIHREEVGRLCCQLAQHATEVYRVTAGIGRRIK